MSGDVWEIIRDENGCFDFFRNGKLLCGSIPGRWLESQLGGYGFCGQECVEIREQLDLFGKARIAL